MLHVVKGRDLLVPYESAETVSLIFQNIDAVESFWTGFDGSAFARTASAAFVRVVVSCRSWGDEGMA